MNIIYHKVEMPGLFLPSSSGGILTGLQRHLRKSYQFFDGCYVMSSPYTKGWY